MKTFALEIFHHTQKSSLMFIYRINNSANGGHTQQTAGTESDFFTEGVLDVSSLTVGTRLRLGWQPDRVCEVRYLGDYRFIVESVTNGSLRVGDTFSCLQLQRGKPLYMDCFEREGEPTGQSQRYAVGRENGLTMVEMKDER